MRETTDTNSQFASDIADGTYTFEVHKVIRREKSGVVMYVWSLDYDNQNGEQVMFRSNMGPLLRTLGCTESKPGIFDWDTDLMEGKKFIATVKHEPDKKDPSKIRQNMMDFKKAEAVDEPPF